LNGYILGNSKRVRVLKQQNLLKKKLWSAKLEFPRDRRFKPKGDFFFFGRIDGYRYSETF